MQRKIPPEIYINTTTMEIRDSQKNKNLQTDPTILPFGIYCAKLNFSKVDMNLFTSDQVHIVKKIIPPAWWTNAVHYLQEHECVGLKEQGKPMSNNTNRSTSPSLNNQ